MWRSFGLVLGSASALLACGSLSDEGPSAGSSGMSGAASAGGGSSGTGAQGGVTLAGATGASAGATGASGGAAGASGSTSASGGAAGALGTNGGSGGSAGTCPLPIANGDVARLTAMEHEDDYIVMGTTSQELRRSIDSNRGQDYDAFTNWDIQWRVKSCATSIWSVSLDVGYRLPKWDPPANADQVLVAQWQRYDTALHCHEYGHAEIGLACANRVYVALSALPGNSDCVALSKSATAAFNQILSDCRTADVKYDTATNHGATMGATFPP